MDEFEVIDECILNSDPFMPPACGVCRDLFLEDPTDIPSHGVVGEAVCRSCELLFACIGEFWGPQHHTTGYRRMPAQIMSHTVTRGSSSVSYPSIRKKGLTFYPFSVRRESISHVVPLKYK